MLHNALSSHVAPRDKLARFPSRHCGAKGAERFPGHLGPSPEARIKSFNQDGHCPAIVASSGRLHKWEPGDYLALHGLVQ